MVYEMKTRGLIIVCSWAQLASIFAAINGSDRRVSSARSRLSRRYPGAVRPLLPTRRVYRVRNRSEIIFLISPTH